jgi:hypothetical protein
LGLVQDRNGMILGWFWGWQATWERNQRWSLQVSIPLSHRKAKPNENQKKKMGKIQGVTNLPPLKKSRPRDLVAQGLNMNIPARGNRFQLEFPFCLCMMLPLNFICLTTWLQGGLFHWILFLANLTSYVTLTPILSCLLPYLGCDELSW